MTLNQTQARIAQLETQLRYDRETMVGLARMLERELQRKLVTEGKSK